MDLNKIKCLSKSELLQKLRQSGFSDVVAIIEDKEIDGDKFVQLREFETFKWKLSLAQKNCLWNCIRQVQANPSLLMMTKKEKPKPIQKPHISEPRSSLLKTDHLKTFKGNLNGLLETSNSLLLKKPSPLPSPTQTDLLSNKKTSTVVKKPAVPLPKKSPSPSPPKNTLSRKDQLPLPQDENKGQDLEDYIDMHPPKGTTSNEEDDGYLSPSELRENDYEAPPNIRNGHERFTRRTLKNTTEKKISSASRVPNTKSDTRLGPSSHVSALSSSQTRNDKKPQVLSRKALPPSGNINLKETAEENDSNIYEPPPPLRSKAVQMQSSANTGPSNKFLNHVYSNTTPTQSNTKPLLKDLGNVIIIDEKEVSQDTPVFSKLTNTLSSFFKKNRSKYAYENHVIQPIKTEQRKVEIPVTIRQRALPTIPPINPTRENQAHSMFERPFPIPRENVSPSKPHSYISLISPINLVKLDKKIEDKNAADEEEQLYENLSGHAIEIKHQKSLPKLGNYHLQTSNPSNTANANVESGLKSDEDEQVYENLESRSEKVKGAKLIQHKAAKVSSPGLVNLYKPHSPVTTSVSEGEETYENTTKVIQFKKTLKAALTRENTPFSSSVEHKNKLNSQNQLQETCSNTSEWSTDEESDQIIGNTILAKNRKTATRLNEKHSVSEPSYVKAIRNTNSEYKNTITESEDENQIYENTGKVFQTDKLDKKVEEQRHHTSFPLSKRVNPEEEQSNNVLSTDIKSVMAKTPLATDLASLLSQQLKAREARLQNKTTPDGSSSVNSNQSGFTRRIPTQIPTVPKISKKRDKSPPESLSEDTFSESDSDSAGVHHHSIKHKDRNINQRPLPKIPNNIDHPASNSTIKPPPLSGNTRTPPTSPIDDSPTYGNVEEKNPRRFPVANATRLSNIKKGPLISSTKPQNYERYHLKHEDQDRASSNSQDSTRVTEDSGSSLFNISGEPFYRNTDRRGARLLLRRLENGAFLFRPSTTFFLVLTIKFNNRYYNLGIQRIDNKLRLNSEGESSPQFSTLREFVDHFIKNPVTFQEYNEVVEILLNPSLPIDNR